MLNQDVKKRIDNARDILVGKVPDPKAQVEQITTALIYKFMDDMDRESEELGGKARFFTNGFEKYSWSKLLDSRLGGHERLNLYSEAIAKMSSNPHLPQLFRDIFKDAFLPYRDSETLNLFLKEINGFNYDHSENLGNAYEYLLSIMGSQGDAGQFRTPRHIIDFIVDVVDPKKDETILDPACGTAGFLISSYKHILKNNTKDKKGDLLTPDVKTKLMNHLVGYDISPDMVRISKVNMYLHGFSTPNIHEYDSLTSDDRWDEMFDVILANPPFMTPKGGIRPHKKFAVQANRAEVLFVDYIAEHLSLKGRAGIIVPEGIIFNSAGAYEKLREKLIEENLLWAVVSLPAGVFNPYSGVKTSILLIDKELAKKSQDIIFVKITNDGFDLGAQRTSIEGNQLNTVITLLKKYRTFILGNQYKNAKSPGEEFIVKFSENADIFDLEPKDYIKMFEGGKLDQHKGNEFKKMLHDFFASHNKERIKGQGNYNLTAEQYKKEKILTNDKYPMAELGEVLEYEQPTKYIVASTKYNDAYKTPVLTAGKTFILGYTNEKDGIFEKDLPVIIFDDFTTAIKLVDFPFKVKSSAMKILHAKKDVADIKYLFYVMKRIKFPSSTHKRYWISEYSKIKIPLPPLEVQKEIVEEIDGYQKIIDGAKQVVDSWKPSLEIDSKWEEKKLGDISDVTSSKRIFKEEYVATGIPFYRTKEIVELSTGEPISLELFISKEKYNLIKAKFDVPKKGEILISAVGTIGYSWVISDNREFYFKDGNLLWIRELKGIEPLYLKLVLDSKFTSLNNLSAGAAYNALTIVKLKEINIPVPTLEIQRQLVEKVEEEQKIVQSNKRMIELFQKKIDTRIKSIWES